MENLLVLIFLQSDKVRLLGVGTILNLEELHNLIKELLSELRSTGSENKDLLNKAQAVVEEHEKGRCLGTGS